MSNSIKKLFGSAEAEGTAEQNRDWILEVKIINGNWRKGNIQSKEMKKPRKKKRKEREKIRFEDKRVMIDLTAKCNSDSNSFIFVKVDWDTEPYRPIVYLRGNHRVWRWARRSKGGKEKKKKKILGN